MTNALLLLLSTIIPYLNAFSLLTVNTKTLLKSSSSSISLFGGAHSNLKRIELSENDMLNSKNALLSLGVPTFHAMNDNKSTKMMTSDEAVQRFGLEAIVPGAYMLHNVFTKDQCECMIACCEENRGFENYKMGKNHHGAMQIIIEPEVADSLFQRIGKHVQEPNIIDKDGNEWHMSGINRRLRVYRYRSNGEDTFLPHIDSACNYLEDDESNNNESSKDVTKDEIIISRYTALIYLNEDFAGGYTNFFAPLADNTINQQIIAAVKPVIGSILIFPQAVGEDEREYAKNHWPMHEGSPVTGPCNGRGKYVIRSDLLFTRTKTNGKGADEDKEDVLFQYDDVVTNTFLPTSLVYDSTFLKHVMPLYNACMGVECAGPLLHSFVRFTKVRQIVEIGAGYTSLWILQALKDNDDELERIRSLQREGKCKLLDYPWTVPDLLETYDSIPARLLCIDNCDHQKETASSAGNVAKLLDLDNYFQFVKGDAFEMGFEEASCDLLWCDFGVGSRMKDFVASAYKSIKPGGFLICHSTLTNQRTRNWLEGVRGGLGVDVTGLPPGEFSEISFLEPMKHYQNSISILQRRGTDPDSIYSEPLYSEYA